MKFKNKLLCILVVVAIRLSMPTVNAQCPITEAPLHHGQSTPNAVWFLDENLGFVIGQGISKTLDGGKSWTSLKNSPRGYLRNGHFLNPSVGYITGPSPAVGTEAMIAKTTDGGQTWTQQSSKLIDDNIWGLSMISEEIGWASSVGGALLYTNNGGKNWEKIWQMPGTADVNIICVYFLDEKNGFIGTMNGIWKSKDGGKTWEKKVPNQYKGPYIFNFGFTPDGKVGYAAGEDYFLSPMMGPIYKTTDGGETWDMVARIMNRTKSVQPVSADTAYAIGTSQVWGTFDGGITWNKVRSNAVSELYDLHFPTKRIGYAVGHANGNVKLVLDNPPPTVSFFQGGPNSIVASSVPGATYQWYLDGDTILGATTGTYDIEKSGLYKVQINLNGCSGISEEKLINYVDPTTSINIGQPLRINIYPNPTTKDVRIKLEGMQAEVLESKIYNTLGKTVISIGQFSSKDEKIVDVGHLPKGVYIIKVSTNKGSVSQKLIIK